MATETSESTETTGSTERLVGHQTVERLLGTSLYVVSGLLLLFLWVPLAIIIFLAFAENAVTIFPFEGLTLDNFRLALRSDSMRSSLVGSFTIATVAASIATILGVLASFALTRYRFRLREVYRTFGIIPMVIPGIILGVALRIYFQNLLGILPGFATVVLAHSLYGLPFVLLIVSARLYTYDESLEEAARDLGADPLTVFRDVTLPVIAPAVGAGFLFAWIRSFEDYIRALFLTGPNTDVLTIWMFSRIRQLDAPELNAVSAIIVFGIAIALAVAMNVGNVTGYVAGTVTEEEE
ncbi:spermidine/putrescine ABC transporter permease [Halorubrum sp. E3]|uniref:Spermidine/putrescine ABC transporter permease ii n=6 Tax=Halorubrum distributum TaxID=29283 RepID=M0EIU9_9EURY|nr:MULTISPECIES: ABC transporter permease [Halorubrum distributum group]OYR57756.1 spermidine/putrescine ABC transporter permease [Halorubrum sp. E3]OYR87080.1 spermidine/putrescine ABC transporter permease [Halorubrum distributum]PHQ46371.1 spermidine/putrescine ABC transporter permease [Halorubrum sp. C3]ELZ28374.1 spermidine/putrescine ABC transporter permease ii [Halorubrum terrestre JCM 10247]ELZ47701.1 spermidine/putrescine ABC transporter permease ii [Halorubrum distributum JCM 9100]